MAQDVSIIELSLYAVDIFQSRIEPAILKIHFVCIRDMRYTRYCTNLNKHEIAALKDNIRFCHEITYT